jgi:1-deoxy-D-xylulose-5-phosphate reductoisomerase
VAVEAFLDGRIGWLEISQIVAQSMLLYEPDPLESVEALMATDFRARDVTNEILAARMRA